MSNFEKTLFNMGYALKEQVGNKLTFQKKLPLGDLVLIFDLDGQYINPILVPGTLILFQKDIDKLQRYFYTLREDAEYLQSLTKNSYKVLN